MSTTPYLDILLHIALCAGGTYKEWESGQLAPFEGAKEERAASPLLRRDFQLSSPTLLVRETVIITKQEFEHYEARCEQMRLAILTLMATGYLRLQGEVCAKAIKDANTAPAQPS